MGKTKLGICMLDMEYMNRFIKCVMKHYRDSYEIHVLKQEASVEDENLEEMDIIIRDSCLEAGGREPCLILQEEPIEVDEELSETIHYTDKYQEVYKIMEFVDLLAQKERIQTKIVAGIGRPQLIGVFSLSKEAMQIPFLVLLAEILGEKHKVLVVDLQPYSGFSTGLEVEADTLGMEDVMAMAMAETYTPSRLASSIGCEQKWDYIYPAKNVLCLAEGDMVLYQKIIQLLQKERGYEVVILNFGSLFTGVLEMMAVCDSFYMLIEENKNHGWRERVFIKELEHQEKSDFLEKIQWVGIPTTLLREENWRDTMMNWLWDEMGDQLRKSYWME